MPTKYGVYEDFARNTTLSRERGCGTWVLRALDEAGALETAMGGRMEEDREEVVKGRLGHTGRWREL